MKIALIHVGIRENGFNTFGKSLGNSQINHGLCSISAYAKSKGYNDISLIDMRKIKGWQSFKKKISQKQPGVIGISFMSCDFNAANKAIDCIKEVSTDCKIVVGGVHPSVATEEVAANNRIDYIIVGEGEISFAKLLNDIENDSNSSRIIIGEKPDLNELPFEDRELYDYNTSIKFTNFPGFYKAPMVSMVASRGCPFNCAFCAPHAKTIFGPKVRYQSVDNVIQEIGELYEKYKFKSLAFYDYSFFLNKDWMHEFCDKFDKIGFKTQIWANCRADLICSNEKGIKRLKDIGLRMIAIGMESGSQKILDFLKKGTTVEQNIRAAQICKNNGIAVRGLFMLGIPTETKEDVRATINLIRKIQPDIYSFSYFTPMPGTFLFEYCQEHNLSLIKSHDELANMGPDLPKIKNVDYDFLKSSVEEAMGYRFGGTFMGKIIRYAFIQTRKNYLLSLRYFLKYLYARWVLIRNTIKG